MPARRTALTLVLLVLVPATLAVLAPSAAARHVCFPHEPPWSCEHRDPTLREAFDYACGFLPRPTFTYFCYRVGQVIPGAALP